MEAGGEDGSGTSAFQVLRQPLGCVDLPFRVPPRGVRGDRHVETALGSARPAPRPLPNSDF